MSVAPGVAPGGITPVLTLEETPWCNKTMLITHYDILRGQLLTVHAGSPAQDPPRPMGWDRYMWADGTLDSGLIDWGDDLPRDTRG